MPLAAVDPLNQSLVVRDSNARCKSSSAPNGSLNLKTIAILQVLQDSPASRENVAALVHPAVDASSQSDAVEEAVKNLIAEETVPLAEIDGNLRFMSEAVSELEQERSGGSEFLHASVLRIQHVDVGSVCAGNVEGEAELPWIGAGGSPLEYE